MNKKKKIMIIGAGILQVPAIIKAKELGLYVIALDMNPNAPGFKLSDECIELSTIDIENAVKVALKIKPNAVMTLASDMPMRTVAEIGEKCGLATISKETSINATDKGKMREKLKQKNVSIPKFYVVTNYEEYISATKKFQGNFIVKPVDNSGSRGVYLVNQKSDLCEVFNYVKRYSRSGEILLEEYMIGPEVSVESLTINGVTHVVAITDKITTGAPHFIEMGHSIPSKLSNIIQDEIVKIVVSAIDAVGINIGPSHTEVIVTEEGPKIVELGARLGGDNITTHLVPLATGVDMVEASIRLALGEGIDIYRTPIKGAAIRYMNASIGKIKSINGLKEVENLDGIREIVLNKKIGDYVTEINGSTDRIGYVISQGNSVQEAIKLCEKVVNKITIETKK